MYLSIYLCVYIYISPLLVIYSLWLRRVWTIPLDAICGGISEEQSDLNGEPNAKGEEIGGEGQKAHRGVDTHGFYYNWKPRRTHFHCILSGTAS